MAEFKNGKHIYRAGRMDAMTQFHVMRRLTPCLGKMAGLAGGKVKLIFDAEGNIVDIDGDLDDVLLPLVNAITALSDDEVNFVFNACLEVTERKQAGGAWAPLCVKGTVMFDDITLPVRLQAVYQVVKENLTDFFGELPSLSNLEDLLKAKGLLGPNFQAEKTGS